MGSLQGRVAWRSRRGLLELDIFLSRFLALRLASLSDPELETLLDLLAADDIELWSWVSDREVCPVAEWKELVAAIRQASQPASQ